MLTILNTRLFLVLVLALATATASSATASRSASTVHARHEAIWDTANQAWLQPDDLARLAQRGDILVLGEDHATATGAQDAEQILHHDNQLRLIQSLQQSAAPKGVSVSVGMEFLTYTAQTAVAQYVSGVLSEADFLKAAQWAGNPFEFYRAQILAPRDSNGETVALNIPADVPVQVAKAGPSSLSPAQKSLLPPTWERGGDAYYARFSEIMQGHVKKEQLETYFWAQSLWDDTMAWRALDHRTRYPQDILLIIVGAFHVEYDGGLPFELKKLGQAPVKTIVQIAADDWSDATLKRLTAPDPQYGALANYLWVHEGAGAP